MKASEHAARPKGRALTLFLFFFKIGFYTFGGGWSIVAQIQKEYVERQQWITEEDLKARRFDRSWLILQCG